MPICLIQKQFISHLILDQRGENPHIKTTVATIERLYPFDVTNTGTEACEIISHSLTGQITHISAGLPLQPLIPTVFIPVY